MKLIVRIILCFFWTIDVHAQLAVTVSPVKTTGTKAVVKLAIKNTFIQKIESARAVCFLMDEQGKMVDQATKWVIGGASSVEHGAKKSQPNGTGLAAGAKTTFNFVVPVEKTTTTNLTAKIQFSRVILEGGKSVDPTKTVQIVSAAVP